jgi:hypothetical protein
MNSIGEDVPNQETIDDYGIVSACMETNGNFALYKPGEFAARGRYGASPLYWNRSSKKFSFRPSKNLIEFPVGCAYIYEFDRIVCWDDPFYEKPLKTSPWSTNLIREKIERAVSRFIGKTDGFLYSCGGGAQLANMFVPPDMTAYTVGYFPGPSPDIDLVHRSNRIQCIFDESSHWPHELDGAEIPMYILARFLSTTTNHRRFVTGIGCTELFSGSGDFRPYTRHIVDQFASFGLEVWSPFLDSDVVEYVMDCTSPEDRPRILTELVGSATPCEWGAEIEDTIGDFPTKKKTWWYF